MMDLMMEAAGASTRLRGGTTQKTAIFKSAAYYFERGLIK